MYAGQLVEIGTVEEVFYAARHPYTQALLASYPTLDGELTELKPIPGEPPDLVGPLPGCRFCSRCPNVEASCRLQRPQWRELSPTHHVFCDYCADGGH
jgi:oligopeptide/dipeptide ABC transporter ATP-binding protein